MGFAYTLYPIEPSLVKFHDCKSDSYSEFIMATDGRRAECQRSYHYHMQGHKQGGILH